MAPRRFHLRRPTMCTPAAANALAVRTTVPMLWSCPKFSIATWNGCARLARSAAAVVLGLAGGTVGCGLLGGSEPSPEATGGPPALTVSIMPTTDLAPFHLG